MLDVSLPRVPRTLLRDEAYRLIRDAIVAGTLAPGAVIRDADLAESLGLSRAPVRDALARLSAEGLVESKPQSFTRVTPLVLRDIRDAGAVVRAMHDLAVRAAVPQIGEDELSTMRAANLLFADAVRAGDVDSALAADDALHGVLVRACGNRALMATVERYTPLIRRLERARFGSLAGHRSIRLHDQLITASAAGDVAGAAAVSDAIWSTLDELIDAQT
jgi:DNA-binding GntR family transcriptional regulator